MCWRELGGQDHIAVRVERADLLQGGSFFGQAVNQFTALGVKSQQADPIAMWGRDHSAIRAETEFFDITSANIGFLDAMSQSKGTARGNWPHWRSFLKFVDTSPLQQGGRKI